MRTAAHDIRASLVLAATVGALAATPARAAYAPQLSVTIDPSAQSTSSALTATISQAAGGDPTRAIAIEVPNGFGLTLGGTACDPGQEAAFACPSASSLGLAQAATSQGAYSGGIYYGGPGKVIVLLNNGGLVPQPIALEGRVDTALSFDNVPSVGLTGLTLRFAGAPRALLTTPAQCGQYAFVGHFTSAGGATADSRATVGVDGCTEVPPQISEIAVSPRVTRAGVPATVQFKLSEAATVAVRMRRVGRGTATLVGTLDGRTGRNALAVATRGVRPGAYALELQATDPSGLQRTRSTRLRVVRRR
jgi:hypothetical protein